MKRLTHRHTQPDSITVTLSLSHTLRQTKKDSQTLTLTHTHTLRQRDRFLDLKNSDKEKRVLAWCVGESASSSCLESGEKIKSVDLDPTEISSQLYNEFVNVHSVSYWFEDDAWSKFLDFFHAKCAALKDRCSSCSKSDVPGDDILHCDHCLLNYHHHCAKVKKVSKKRHQLVQDCLI